MKKLSLLSEILCGIFLCSLVLTGCQKEGPADHITEPAADISTVQSTEARTETADHGNETKNVTASTDEIETTSLPFRDDIDTILVMGIDKVRDPEYDRFFGEGRMAENFGYLNNQQTDFMMLLVIDQTNHKCTPLHINRDTMTSVMRLGIGGKPAGHETSHITLAHTYGDGGEKSCLNSCRAVSDLLNGAPINHYVALTMDGFMNLNDAAGGVKVTVPVDMTHYSDLLEEGAEVLLKNIVALRFVKERHYVDDGSNLSRMNRQRYYLNLLHEQFLKCIEKDSQFIKNTIARIAPFMDTDMSAEQLADMCDILKDCELMPFVTIDGEIKHGKFTEYHINDQSRDSVVNELFCE